MLVLGTGLTIAGVLVGLFYAIEISKYRAELARLRSLAPHSDETRTCRERLRSAAYLCALGGVLAATGLAMVLLANYLAGATLAPVPWAVVG